VLRPHPMKQLWRCASWVRPFYEGLQAARAGLCALGRASFAKTRFPYDWNRISQRNFEPGALNSRPTGPRGLL
jgi:hypothetical protein